MSPDKELELHQYVQKQIGKPFRYGRHDCVTFVSKALDIVTDGVMFELIRSRREEGFNQLDEYIEKYGSIGGHLHQVGGKQIDLAYMTTGDFVVLQFGDADLTTGVCLGAKTAINTADGGVQLFPNDVLSNVLEVWRV